MININFYFRRKLYINLKEKKLVMELENIIVRIRFIFLGNIFSIWGLGCANGLDPMALFVQLEDFLHYRFLIP